MKRQSNRAGSRYGAFELKLQYRRNMMLGTLVGALLAIAATAGAFIFTQTSNVSITNDRLVPVDSNIVKIDWVNTTRPKGPRPQPSPPPVISDEGWRIRPITDVWDEEINPEVNTKSHTGSYWIGAPGDGSVEDGNYFDRFMPGAVVVSEYPEPDEPVFVDSPAEIIYECKPAYPRLAITAGMEASVWIKALVDIDGTVRNAFICISSESKAGFDEAALEAAYHCKYKPAVSNGRPIPVWVSYEVEFVLVNCQ